MLQPALSKLVNMLFTVASSYEKYCFLIIVGLDHSEKTVSVSVD